MSDHASTPFRVLLVDDEEQALIMGKIALESEGACTVDTCADSRQALAMLETGGFHAIVIDLMMPYVSGEQLLESISERCPEIAAIVVTAVDDLSTAVSCMRKGAFDYLVKPAGRDALLSSIRRARERYELTAENQRLKERMLRGPAAPSGVFDRIITVNSRMRGVFSYIEAVAASAYPVLVTGETGTGKELIAQAVHALSGRDGEMITVNVAGLDDQLVADTLFGHEQGAFTGAHTRREGLIAKAAGGTLFLDEIGDLGPASQVKLLRLLQERRYYPLGSDRCHCSDARIVAATNRNLAEMQENGQFRRDLYYRLCTHCVELPPLRERPEDIEPLTARFIEVISEQMGKKRPAAPDELYQLLRLHTFPGNVRELEAMVADAISRHTGGMLSTASFSEKILGDRISAVSRPDMHDASAPVSFSGKLPLLREIEPMLITEALRRAGDNQSLAAQMLGVSRQTLNSRIQKMRR